MEKAINTKKAYEAYKAFMDAYNEVKRLRECSASGEEIEAARAAEEAANEKAEQIAKALLGAALYEAQKRTRTRRIDEISIIHILHYIDQKLCISKAAMEGISAVVDLNADHFAKAYNGIPQSTIFEATYKNGSWRVTDIRRDTCRIPYNCVFIRHTEKSKNAIIERFTHL